MALSKIDLANQVENTLGVAQGGTGSTLGTDVLLSTTTISSTVASVSFNSSLITSDYDIYKIIYGNLQLSDGGGHQIRFSPDNGTTVRSTGYHNIRWRVYTGNAGSSFSEDKNYYSTNVFFDSLASTDKGFYEHIFYNLLDSDVKSTCNTRGGFGNTAGYHTNSIHAGRYNTAEAHNYIEISGATGNLISGKISLIGVIQ